MAALEGLGVCIVCRADDKVVNRPRPFPRGGGERTLAYYKGAPLPCPTAVVREQIVVLPDFPQRKG